MYSLLPEIKNCQISKPLCYSVWLRERKTGHFIVPSSELYIVISSICSILGTDKVLFTCIVYHGLSESMLPRVLFQ